MTVKNQGTSNERVAPVLRALYRGPAGLADLRDYAADPTILESLHELAAEGIVSQIGKAGTEVFMLTKKGQHLVEGWAARTLLNVQA